MPVTRDQIEKLLNVDEPNYPAAARLGVGALPYLEAMAREEGPALGLKAVHLASIISADASTPVINAAAQRADPVFRVAAAAALSRLSADRVADIAVRLVADPEESVRRRVISALPARSNPDLEMRLGQLADSLPTGARKDHVVEALRKVQSGP